MNTKICKVKRFNLYKLYRLSLLLVFSSFIYKSSLSQTTNISGVVNTYHSVLSIASSNAVKVDNPTGLVYGNTVLLIQMKGATINTTASSSSFGDVTAMNDAGNYELAIICSVSNDTVSFFNDILNTYDVNSKVQLVKFGEYYSANVIDTLKAQAWNNTTGKGGVLAIQVEEDLTLNAPIFADGLGYAGGSYLLHSGTCSNFLTATAYAYDGDVTSANQSGAFKGEGVANVAANQDGGRGAPANGGGGGNNHNNGGGGGANLAAGGDGGGNFSSTGCTGNRKGLGGKFLTSMSGTKIFLGGGGGAGHSNNNTALYGGGNGGGIIIILTKNIFGNNFKISANGQVGASNNSDGASGGGAGGTIIMNTTNTYSGLLTIEANGGGGGNADDDLILNRCYGAGGGGSGGAIYFNGTVPAVSYSVNGGTAGLDIDINGCGTPVPATNGSNGITTSSYTYLTSTTPSSNCTAAALPVRIIYFNAQLKNSKVVRLEWDIANPEEANSFTIEKLDLLNHWVEINNLNADDLVHHYETNDLFPTPGENIYRLRINSKDNSHIYSIQKKVAIKHSSHYTVYPNPAKDKIVISGKLNNGTIISLTDITGKLIKENFISSATLTQEFKLPSLNPGIYLIRIENEIKKIVIQ